MATSNASEDEDKSVQMYAALGFGVVCILIGVPIWWKSTEVYRVSLPYSDISSLSLRGLEVTININIINADKKLGDEDLLELSQKISTQLNIEKPEKIKCHYRLSVREAAPVEKEIFTKSASVKELDSKFTVEDGEINSYRIYVLPDKGHYQLLYPYMGVERNIFTSSLSRDLDKRSSQLVNIIRNLLVKEQLIEKSYQMFSHQEEKQIILDKESMRSVRYDSGYDATFSLVIPQPDVLDVHWDIEEAVDFYLKPFVEKMKDYADIRINSQVLFFMGLLRNPQKDHKNGEFFFTDKDLPHVINSLEAKLGSHTSNRQNLNFLVYIPKRDQHPLFLHNIDGSKVESNAFLIPQWGGICIHNVASLTKNDSLPKRINVDMKRVMEPFVTQLRLLLGFPDTQSAELMLYNEASETFVYEWEIDAWLRIKTVENLGISINTLQSLAQLLDKISNIVIRDDIGQLVGEAVQSIKESFRHLRDGRLERAFLESKNAIQCSEKAFFDHSLLELLYFPEDQKFAIYIPLFLPISLPVFSSLWKAFQWYRSKRKVKKD